MELQSRICFLNKHDTKNNIFRSHSHDCYELVYFLAGSGRALIGDAYHKVTPHSYYIVPPYTEHTEDIHGYGEILFIGFTLEPEQAGFSRGVSGAGEIAKRSLLESIFDEYKGQALGYETAANALLKLFLIQVLRNTCTEDKKCKDLQYIKAYIEQYADQKINFRELSDLSGYSYDYFRHIFKEKVGVSPQEYMIDIRLQNARHLLESTNLSCTEIAYNCGFSNSAQMASMFKQKFGKSPTAFKITD